MKIEQTLRPDPGQAVSVYDATDFIAVDGANLGDPLAIADELIEGDVYRLAAAGTRRRLTLLPADSGFVICGPDSEPDSGARVAFDSCVTLMSPDGTVIEVLLMRTARVDGTESLLVYPLADMQPRTSYAIVDIDRGAARSKFAQTACVSFVRGTRITMASGTQVPVEDLSVGDCILTRDHGVQPIRWIDHRTVRAAGAFAPICIRAGVLNNSGDLVVSPNHCLFVYQRRDRIGAGRAELLVRAKYLLNDDTVTRTPGGFVDYYQMAFDRHEIVYAEGIAAETMLIDEYTRDTLPDGTGPAVTVGSRRGYEIAEGTLDASVAVELLRRASVG